MLNEGKGAGGRVKEVVCTLGRGCSLSLAITKIPVHNISTTIIIPRIIKAISKIIGRYSLTVQVVMAVPTMGTAVGASR